MDLFNLPNRLTLARILLIPVFLVFLYSGTEVGTLIALLVFAIMAATDSLDGYLARTWKQETKTGKFLDPLADKFIITAAFISLVDLRGLPAWIAIIIIGREFIVSGLRSMSLTSGKDMPASNLGKAKTFFQIVAILFWIVNFKGVTPVIGYFAWGTLIIALVLTVYSGIDYFIHLKERSV